MGSKSSPSRTASSPSPSRISVKKEAPEEGVKDFAETAMNELLGWYGYERLELRRWAAARPARSPAAPDADAVKERDECSWCNNPITTETGALHQSGSKFCSELCFSQSRRATFKRAKTCDWCRHVRHTVAYVDFQDGATQLQFCSDKCLNQYKMHIFCRETQAHLDLNPHLVNASSTSNLITPDLWLRNCKSRSVSPNSERSLSPTAENLVQATAVRTTATDGQSPSDSPPRRKSPPPVITVAPTSKLLKSKKTTSEDRVTLRNSPESKREGKHPKVLGRKRHNSRCSATVTSQTARQLTNNTAAKAQDLRLCSPCSNIDSSPPLSMPVTPNARLTSPTTSVNNRIPNIPNSNFQEPLYTIPPPGYMEQFPNHFNDPRMPRPFFHPPSNFIPAMPPNMFHQERPKLPGIPPLPQFGMNQPPPVTVLVPYPIVLPVPLPIPVPIPVLSLFQALCGKIERKNDIVTDNGEESEGPLDFTVNVNKNKVDDIRQGNFETESPLNITCNNEEVCNEPNTATKDSLPFVQPTESKSDDLEHANPEQDLPRFKITRLGAKMAKIISKPRENSEFTRPLRKRRRLVNVPSDEEHSPLLAKTQKTVHV